MRQIIAFHSEQTPEGLTLSRCINGETDKALVKTWAEVCEWLTRDPITNNYFYVCFSLFDFTKDIFSLLPENKRKELEEQRGRVYIGNSKVFYAAGRYLGITVDYPIAGNRIDRREINMQALSWWTDEEETPANAREVWELGNRILKVLDGLKFYPTKLTSPVSVFMDSFMGDLKKYPTIWKWDESKFGAMEYATQIMRYEWRSAYKIGHFAHSYEFDRTSAYPATIAQLPSTDNCRCEYSETKPSWATWGLVKGEVDIQVDVSPIVGTFGEEWVNYKGKHEDVFTTRDIEWLERWRAGTFKLKDGWWFRFGAERPYKTAVDYLFPLKQQKENKDLSVFAKRSINGLSGKLDQDNNDGKKGDLYNPILACIVRDENRLEVGNFIYRNGIQKDVIAVIVDSVLSTSDLKISGGEKLGSWRHEGDLPALVLSKGNIWRQGKKPQGLSYDEIIAALKENPEKAYYEFKTKNTVRNIDLTLGGDNDRVWKGYPETGNDLLTKIYESEAALYE